VDERARTASPALARRHGRELAALAYLVLQNREAAEQSAARGMANVLRRPFDASRPDEARLRDALIGATLRMALDAHPETPEIDPLAGPTARSSLTGLSPLQRAVAAGHLAGGVVTDRLAEELAVPVRRVRAELARGEAIAGGREPLRLRLIQRQAGLPFSVAPEAVESARIAPPAGRRGSRWPLTALPIAAMLVAAMAVASTRDEVPAGESAMMRARSEQPSAPVALLAPDKPADRENQPAPPLDARLSLGDCDIQPASTELAFRGWMTLGDLSAATAGTPDAGTPVYALVTAGTAEWVGWQIPEGRPMFPRPVGRMACAVNPVSTGVTVFAVPASWTPPQPKSGCPASPISLYAGDRQVGGPSAFVVLPRRGMSLSAEDPSLRMRVRIAPPPAAEARVTATARPLDGGRPLRLEVESGQISTTRPPTSDHYIWLRGVRFPTDGCWLVSVSVDGEPIGAAIVAVTKRPR
jgi:hypothetical protein